MDDFDEIWNELTQSLRNQPRCEAHPDYPCVYTLGNEPVPNDVIDVNEHGVELYSHESKTGENRFIPRKRFAKTWGELSKGGPVEFRTGNHGSIVGAIDVQCLSDQVVKTSWDKISFI